MILLGFSGSSAGKELNSWVGKIHWRRDKLPTPVFPGGSDGKESSCNYKMQETWILFLGWEDLLEEGTAAHSSILAWRIPWTEEPGRLQSMGLQRPLSPASGNLFSVSMILVGQIVFFTFFNEI